MKTAENPPSVAVFLFGDADLPRPLTGLPALQANLSNDLGALVGPYRRLVVVGADADLGAVLTRLLRAQRLDVEVGFAPPRRTAATRAAARPSSTTRCCSTAMWPRCASSQRWACRAYVPRSVAPESGAGGSPGARSSWAPRVPR